MFKLFPTAVVLWSWRHETSPRNIEDLLKQKFDVINTQGHFGVGANDSLSLAEDPQHPGQYVMKVFYKKGKLFIDITNKNTSNF